MLITKVNQRELNSFNQSSWFRWFSWTLNDCTNDFNSSNFASELEFYMTKLRAHRSGLVCAPQNMILISWLPVGVFSVAGFFRLVLLNCMSPLHRTIRLRPNYYSLNCILHENFSRFFRCFSSLFLPNVYVMIVVPHGVRMQSLKIAVIQSRNM